MKQDLTKQLVDIYFASRPNLDIVHKPFSVFFFACSGAGKSTVRRHLVSKLGATYVCNDEVREMFEIHPEAELAGVQLKDVVAETAKKIIAVANNKFIVYDNIIVKYYMHDDSYLNVSRAQHFPDFIIGIDTPEQELAERIKARGTKVPQILSDLPDQLRAYKAATKDITPSFIFDDTHDEAEMQSLTSQLSQALSSPQQL